MTTILPPFTRMCFKDLSKHGDIAHLLLRLAVAAIFINHGMQKWPMLTGPAPEGMSDTMLLIMKLLAITEPLAGVALILGLLTQVAALGLCVVMISALYTKISGDSPMNRWEIDMILLVANIVLIIEGPGKYSLDAMWMKKKR